MSGIPTISTRTRSLGQSTGGKRIIPKRGPRTTSLTIPEDAEAPIKPRITSAPMRASVREEHGVLGETRGGGNIKRAVENLGDEKEGMVKEANSVAVERRIRVLEANCRTKEQKDAIKFDEINATIADIRADIAIRSFPSAPQTINNPLQASTQTPRSIRPYESANISTPTRTMPSRLAQTFNMSEFGVNPASLAGAGSPPVPAVLSRQNRQSALRRISMTDISSSFLGDSTVERAVPRSLEEDMSMGDMSFADLANLSSEQNEDEGVEVNEAADPTLIPGLATSSTEVRPNAANDTTSISSTGPDLHNEQITELRHNIEELKDELESLKREYDAQQAELQQTMAKSIEPLNATISGHSLHIAELQEDVCTAKTMVTAQRNETQRLTARLEAAEGAAQEARDLADKRDEDIRDLRNTVAELEKRMCTLSSAAPTTTAKTTSATPIVAAIATIGLLIALCLNPAHTALISRFFAL